MTDTNDKMVSSLDEVIERLKVLKKELFSVSIEEYWFYCLWLAYNGEAVLKCEGLPREAPDFKGVYMEGTVIQELVNMLDDVSPMSFDDALEMVTAELADELETYGVKLKWDDISKGVVTFAHLFIIPVDTDESSSQETTTD